MQLYDCTVRLNGSLYNEVPKSGVTAAEIAVLKAIHQGPDVGTQSVHNIRPTKHVDRENYDERMRLEQIYGPAVAKHEHIKTLTALFGHVTAPLPQTVPGVDSLPPPKEGRRAKVGTPKPVEETAPETAEPIAADEFN